MDFLFLNCLGKKDDMRIVVHNFFIFIFIF